MFYPELCLWQHRFHSAFIFPSFVRHVSWDSFEQFSKRDAGTCEHALINFWTTSKSCIKFRWKFRSNCIKTSLEICEDISFERFPISLRSVCEKEFWKLDNCNVFEIVVVFPLEQAHVSFNNLLLVWRTKRSCCRNVDFLSPSKQLKIYGTFHIDDFV